jgi:nicotinamidase-related amidase
MIADETLPFAKDGIRFGPLGDHWAHLCVDMQRMFAGPGPWMTPWMPQVLPNVVRLVEMQPARTLLTRFVPPSRPEDLPGAWVRYYRRWPDMTLENLDPEMLLLVPELDRFAPPARIVDKRVYSPWMDGALLSQLQATNTSTLVVSGAETEVCVLATVLGAIDFGSG